MFTIYLFQMRSLYCDCTHELHICSQITMIKTDSMRCLQHDIVHNAQCEAIMSLCAASITFECYDLCLAIPFINLHTVPPVGMRAVLFSK